jgi:hypothetical protein
VGDEEAISSPESVLKRLRLPEIDRGDRNAGWQAGRVWPPAQRYDIDGIGG